MELSKEYKSLSLNLPVSGIGEEFELDYQENLPAYLDDVEKIIKCSSKCSIVDYEINSGCISIYGKALISITYLSSQGLILSNIFEEDFTKSVDVDSDEEISFADISLKTKYSSSRLINQRRVDVHISIDVKIRPFKKNSMTVLTNCRNAFVREENEKFLSERYSSVTTTDFDESFNVSNSSQIKNIINVFTSSSVEEYKVIKEKMLVRIKTVVSLLYSTDDDNVERFEYSFTSSKIIDVPNSGEDDKALIITDVSSLYVKTKTDKDNKLNEIELVGRITISYRIVAQQEETFITDSYMTSYNTKAEYKNISIRSNPQFFSDAVSSQLVFDIDGKINEVLDAKLSIASFDIINSALRYSVRLSLLYYDGDSNMRFAEKTLDTELVLSDIKQNGVAAIGVKSFDYVIKDSQNLSVKLNAEYCAYLYDESVVKFTTDIEECGKKDKSCSSPLTLYFAEKGENVWDIAKEFSTDLTKISEENGLSADVINEKRILLISEM